MLIIGMQKKYEEFKINNLGNYGDLYVRSETLLITGVFKNFRNKCIEIY